MDNDDHESFQEEFLAEDDDADPPKVHLRMPVSTARAFAKRTREVVGARRPICVICGQPTNADGHTYISPES